MQSVFALEMAAFVAAALGGTLLVVAGVKGGNLARRGERPRWIGIVFGIVAGLGGIMVIVGLVAKFLNQPANTWLGYLPLGTALLVFTKTTNYQLEVLRGQALRSRIEENHEPNTGW